MGGSCSPRAVELLTNLSTTICVHVKTEIIFEHESDEFSTDCVIIAILGAVPLVLA